MSKQADEQESAHTENVVTSERKNQFFSKLPQWNCSWRKDRDNKFTYSELFSACTTRLRSAFM